MRYVATYLIRTGICSIKNRVRFGSYLFANCGAQGGSRFLGLGSFLLTICMLKSSSSNLYNTPETRLKRVMKIFSLTGASTRQTRNDTSDDDGCPFCGQETKQNNDEDETAIVIRTNQRHRRGTLINNNNNNTNNQDNKDPSLHERKPSSLLSPCSVSRSLDEENQHNSSPGALRLDNSARSVPEVLLDTIEYPTRLCVLFRRQEKTTKPNNPSFLHLLFNDNNVITQFLDSLTFTFK